MESHQALVDAFLAGRRIAVAGASPRQKRTGNVIFDKLRACGYEAIPLHPEAEAVDGVRAYRSLREVPGGVDGVVIVTRPEVTEKIVEDAAAAGVPRVWFHNNTLTPTCGSEKAVATCREHGIAVIEVGCPMMFLEPDVAHRCMKWWLHVTRRMPRPGAAGPGAASPGPESKGPGNGTGSAAS